MSSVLEILLGNAVVAAIFAALAWPAARVVKRPSVAHALWAIALLRLLVPPLVPFQVPLPDGLRPSDVSASRAQAILPSSHSVAGRAPVRASRLAGAGDVTQGPLEGSERGDGSRAVALSLLLGAVAVLTLAVVRLTRFQRILDAARPAPASMRSATRELASKLGLKHVPPLRIVDAVISPMVVARRSGTTLLWPRALVDMPAPERDSLLVHELAHVRRRDHWMRFAEIAATALFWWSPVTWWTRRALRAAEERCCDEWVLRTLPGAGRSYASGLLKTVMFLSRGGHALPATASPASLARDIEGRLKEVLMDAPQPRLGSFARLTLAPVALAALLAFPTFGEPPVAPEPPPEPAPALVPEPPVAPDVILPAVAPEIPDPPIAPEYVRPGLAGVEEVEELGEVEILELQEVQELEEFVAVAPEIPDPPIAPEYVRPGLAGVEEVEELGEVAKKMRAGLEAEAEALRASLEAEHAAFAQQTLGHVEEELEQRAQEITAQLEKLTAERDLLHDDDAVAQRETLEVQLSVLEATRRSIEAEALAREGSTEDARKRREEAEVARARAEEKLEVIVERAQLQAARGMEKALALLVKRSEKLRESGRDEEVEQLEEEAAELRRHIDSLR